MRLFVTTYQKSGTHQIMPALRIDQDVVDRSRNELTDLPKRYGRKGTLCQEGIEETCGGLREFYDKAFGHVSYLPEYAEAVQAQSTKVLFNVRDPRDVVISEYFSAAKNKWPNLYVQEYGKSICDLDDPISELIELAAVRWPKWLGWINHDFVKVVKYEDLRLRPFETFGEIAEWLEPYHINPDFCASNVEPRKKNPTFRRGIPGEWKTGMTVEQKKLSRKLLGNIIERLGYTV